MNTRQDGYYWVKFGNEWMCARWSEACNGYWTIPMVDTKLKDSNFSEILENRIPSPDEMPHYISRVPEQNPDKMTFHIVSKEEPRDPAFNDEVAELRTKMVKEYGLPENDISDLGKQLLNKGEK